MFRRKGKGVKTIKVLRTQKKSVLVINTSQDEHMLGLL